MHHFQGTCIFVYQASLILPSIYPLPILLDNPLFRVVVYSRHS
jgi:hypothetical protein